MTFRKGIRIVVSIVVVAGLITVAMLTRDTWYERLLALTQKQEPASEAEQDHGDDRGPAHGSQDRLKLSPQAQATLNLNVGAVELQSYWQSLQVPGHVVERPGRSDQGVVTVFPGVVTEVDAVPGEVVRPGQKLFTIRVISDHLQTSQRELYQIHQEMEINREEKARLQKLAGAIPEIKLLDLDYAYRRLKAKEESYRFELTARGLSQKQIEGITEGEFITEITVHAPQTSAMENERLVEEKTVALGPTPRKENEPLFDVEELKVHRGDQVEAGASLCILSEHEVLYLEGRVFKNEIPLVQQAMQRGWPVEMRTVQEEKLVWSSLPSLKILFVGNGVDPDSQTVPVYVPVENQYRQRSDYGKQFRLWRFRPAQRVFLRIPVEEHKNVIVLPKEAVVREGAEHYVFQQNGDAYDRKEVEVLYQDRSNVIIANDGVLIPGVSYVAHNGAAQLQRALAIQSSSGKVDPHAGHVH